MDSHPYQSIEHNNVLKINQSINQSVSPEPSDYNNTYDAEGYRNDHGLSVYLTAVPNVVTCPYFDPR